MELVLRLAKKKPTLKELTENICVVPKRDMNWALPLMSMTVLYPLNDYGTYTLISPSLVEQKHSISLPPRRSIDYVCNDRVVKHQCGGVCGPAGPSLIQTIPTQRKPQTNRCWNVVDQLHEDFKQVPKWRRLRRQSNP
eukprot:PhF_6_TR31816/c1_g4_i1/m.46994